MCLIRILRNCEHQSHIWSNLCRQHRAQKCFYWRSQWNKAEVPVHFHLFCSSDWRAFVKCPQHATTQLNILPRNAPHFFKQLKHFFTHFHSPAVALKFLFNDSVFLFGPVKRSNGKHDFFPLNKSEHLQRRPVFWSVSMDCFCISHDEYLILCMCNHMQKREKYLSMHYTSLGHQQTSCLLTK